MKSLAGEWEGPVAVPEMPAMSNGKPLHVSEIIERVHKQHGLTLERESIVSTLTKKVNRGSRFVRTDKNVFALKGGD